MPILPVKMEIIKINTDPIAGCRDFPPSEMRKRNWLFNKWITVSKQFGFEQYDAPVVEDLSLYIRKGGDDITKEMYGVELPDGTKHALRPEMTPSLARLMMKLYNKYPHNPLRWFSLPQCWRYETTTKGRKREHYQWNVDIFAEQVNLKYEIELFQIITTFFESVGLTPTDVTIRVSNRQILQKVLNRIGISDDLFEKSCVIIDKSNKLSPEDFRAKLMDEVNMSSEGVDTIVKLIGVKDVDGLSAFLPADDLTLLEVQGLFNLARAIGIDQWLEFDASVVRGLSYYTGLVFEGFFKSGSIKRAVCGGGRYDNLLQSYGHNKRVPAIGFGFGDVVILEVLEELKLLTNFEPEVDFVIIPFNDNLYAGACAIATQLRSKGKNVITYAKGGKRAKAFEYASKVGANMALYIAPDEWKNSQMVVKYMKEADLEKKQMTVNVEEFINSI
jgi:histidyl-tRNA synthetase